MVEIRENINCFQYMFFYIYIIFSFVYMRLLIKNIPGEDDINFFVKIADYWKKKPIWKMVVRNDDIVPDNMEKYSFGTWPGTHQGCNCSKSSSSFYNFYKDYCSSDNIIKNCINVEEQKPVNIYNYYFKYYVSYYDSDYLSLLSRIEKENGSGNKTVCKNNYKRCGFLDNKLSRPFCVKKDEDCVMNYFFFEESDGYIWIYCGFHESFNETNNAVNNIFLADSSGCILNEDYLYDNFILFKNKSDKLIKCKPQHSENMYIKISNSDRYKKYVYLSNYIYDGYESIPNEYDTINLYAMIYYGLDSKIDKYYYADISIFKNLRLYNILIFIILKVGIQLGYFIFINKAFFQEKYKEIIFNIIWAFIFITCVILIFLFNNSVYRTSILISEEIGDNLYKVIKELRIIDIIAAFIILFVHVMKLLYIILSKGKKKYSEFINRDK